MPSRRITRSDAHATFVACCFVLMLAASAIHQHAYAQAAKAPARPTRLPKNYRKWQLISVAHEEGDLNDLRGILANDVAVGAFRSNAAEFPEGSKIVRLAWRYSPSAENNRAFGRTQSYVAGARTNIQLMVKDSSKYAATYGWGYAQFAEPDGKNEAAHPNACAACHLSARDHGQVFTRYSR